MAEPTIIRYIQPTAEDSELCELGMTYKNLNEINISESSTDEAGKSLSYLILDAGSAEILID